MMPYESTDELSQRLEAADSGEPHPTMAPTGQTLVNAEEEDYSAHQDVFVIEDQCPVLFTKRIEITPGSLASWEPELIFEDLRDDEDA